MATKSGGGITGSGTPWTAQQFSAWKRREKGRLVKLRTALVESSDLSTVESYAALMKQVDACEREVNTLPRAIAALAKQVHGPTGSGPLDAKKDLEHRIRELDREIENRFFTGSLRAERELWMKDLKQARQRATSHEQKVRSASQARRQRKEMESLLKKARQRLPRLVKVQTAVKDLGLANSPGSLGNVIDKRLADLDEDAPPPWVMKAVTAYVKERATEDQEAVAGAAKNRKQLEKNSKELADLQRSEAATLKRIESLERRLARENERVLAERKFIYKKLWNKRGATPGLSKRERSFLKEYHIPFRSEHWSDNDPNYNNRTWTSDPKHKDWATAGVEFSAKLRTSARKIEELEADIEELKPTPARIRALKSSIRKLEKDIATADKANAAAGGWPKGKAPRIGYIANAHAFEKYMAEWMRWLGWDDAKAMPVGPDEGIDVKATGALGQAKHWDTEVGIEEVQRHNGVCDGIQKYGRVFLSKSGYTPQAIKWANDRDLPLFEMKAGSKDAGVVASSKAGEKLLKVGAKAMKGNKRN